MIDILVGLAAAGGAALVEGVKEWCVSDQAKQLGTRALKMGAKKAYQAYNARQQSDHKTTAKKNKPTIYPCPHCGRNVHSSSRTCWNCDGAL